MKVIEYGNNNNEVIILLHGGGLSWWNYKEVAELLQQKYHIIIPVLDGHSESDRPFTSIENNAAEIIEYIDSNFGGSVTMIGGLSLGGQILVEILSQRSNICKAAVIESALIIPMKTTYHLVKPMIEMSYGLIKKRWFAKLQFKSLKIKSDLFDCYFRDTCAISKKDMIAFLQANSLYSLKRTIKNCTAKVYIFVGGKENNAMQKSAQIIHQSIQGSLLQVLTGMYHGEFSINWGKDYANKIREIIEN